jgi:PAS domain S-box-containing protein
MVDITDRKAAEDAVRRQHRLYRSLLEHSSDDIALLSADGRTVYQTPAVAQQLGYRPEELVGQNNLDLYYQHRFRRRPCRATKARRHEETCSDVLV